MFHSHHSMSASALQTAYARAQKAHHLLSKHARATSHSPSGEGKSSFVGQLTRTGEVAASAFTFGVINGRFGAVDLAGIPIDLGIGTVLQVLAFAGVGGTKASSHMHAVADGTIAAYMTKLGAGVGAKMRAAKNLAPSTSSNSAFNKTTWAGELPPNGNMPGSMLPGSFGAESRSGNLTDAELMALAESNVIRRAA